MKNALRCLIPGLLVCLALGVATPAHAAAMRTNAGFNTNILPRNDDGSTGLVNLGFTVNFFGVFDNDLFVNNNGNVTFSTPLGIFTPFGLTGPLGQAIIAPFFADVDTRNTSAISDVVTYGNDTVNGRPAFGVNWGNATPGSPAGVGYFAVHVDRLNNFQLVLIDRSDISPGDFDIEFNYNRIQWETGDASGGSGGLGGTPARVGFSNGSGAPGTNFELPGSGVSTAFLDSGPASTRLIDNMLNSTEPGRYVFNVRGGVVQGDAVPEPGSLALFGLGMVGLAGYLWRRRKV